MVSAAATKQSSSPLDSKHAQNDDQQLMNGNSSAPAVANGDELLDYEEEEHQAFSLADAKSQAQGKPAAGDQTGKNNASPTQMKGAYSSIHSSGFRDFILKTELMTAIKNAGFEHPSTGNLVFKALQGLISIL